VLGKVLRRRYRGLWLSAAIVEAEAYYLREKGSHASLGRTPSREALFMAAGTLYMYHSRAGDSLNVSCEGEGNAMLLKAGVPVVDDVSGDDALALMRSLHPRPDGALRPVEKQCAGQTLLCRSLALRIGDWNCRTFDEDELFLDDVGYAPEQVVVARRLGISPGRDEHLLYRYVDAARARSATQNPFTRRDCVEGRDYYVLARGVPDPNCG
jgi:DNA-3-methyladenine glycosylase